MNRATDAVKVCHVVFTYRNMLSYIQLLIMYTDYYCYLCIYSFIATVTGQDPGVRSTDTEWKEGFYPKEVTI